MTARQYEQRLLPNTLAFAMLEAYFGGAPWRLNMPAHELRDAFAEVVGPIVTVTAARMRYGQGNHQIIEIDGLVPTEGGGQKPFSITSGALRAGENPIDGARKLGAEFKAQIKV